MFPANPAATPASNDKKYCFTGLASALVTSSKRRKNNARRNADEIWLILDDERARTAAISAGFQVIGLLGILLLAKERKLIPAVKPLLDELQDKNFRVSDKIRREVLRKAKE